MKKLEDIFKPKPKENIIKIISEMKKLVKESLNESLKPIKDVIISLQDIFEQTFFDSNIQVENKDNHIFIRLGSIDNYENIIKDLIYKDTKDLFDTYGFKVVNVDIKKEKYETLVDIEVEINKTKNIEIKKDIKPPKYNEMGQNELNFQLNNALDKKDYKTAEEIGKYMKIKESFIKLVKESLDDVLKPKSEEEIDNIIKNKNLKSLGNNFIKAAMTGNVFIVKKLFNRVNKFSKEWALIVASSSLETKETIEIIKFLLDNGVNIHIKSDYPLRIACFFSNEEIVKILLEYGADATAENENNNKLRNFTGKIDHFNKYSKNPLYDTIHGMFDFNSNEWAEKIKVDKKTNIVKILLNTKNNFPIEQLNEAVFCAILHSKEKYFNLIEMIEILIKYGACLNYDIMKTAIWFGQFNIVKLLIKMGIDVKNIDTQKMLMGANRENKEFIIDLLKRNGSK